MAQYTDHATSEATSYAVLDQLDEDYARLKDQEAILLAALERLRHEENCLKEVLLLTNNSGLSAAVSSDVQANEAAAVKRLQNALFESSSDDDDDGADNAK